ncbi:MAG: cyclic nucleotide-binding domain-containing protein, partial [Gemmatimonadetes bacterium]|nr:cyclic nucleotide-binding domain-containing protein [Gemmatimonadota bacterium]NIU33846.1 cyclic nucleotide-binding domain-containing protein [Gemmatimonadota bacterium]NIU38044.1 cyclic nucleotide-binding domain-containing protein [Gemmatimonadota bacterium]NIW66923.1 cyclic nucleotide-binding domain-containing protein [Gemmatimonadota bacterium]
EWLVSHGQLEVYEAGHVIAPEGKRVEHLWIVLSGKLGVRVDRGAGPRLVMNWIPGDVSGMLPYSRMKGPPGDNYVAERSELLMLHRRHFTEMTVRCPMFTALTVHLMLDRARSFNTSDLQDEKMISLGKLAAGLAHELNNPASATVRGAKHLLAGLERADAASRAVGSAGLTREQMAALETLRAECIARPVDSVRSPIDQADREDEIADWLVRHEIDWSFAQPLAEAGLTLEDLKTVADVAPDESLDAAVQWIAAGCTTHSLARDIERAATRIHELVAAVKKFTHMDNLAGPEHVDVEEGLRDTVRVMASKARSKSASITLEIEDDLPRVYGTGGELNQVWLNLIENAVDAIGHAGRVEITARSELDRVVVRVTDDGPGIPSDLVAKIFDPFFTTKPPGEGTGLGLDITRRLLRRYQGDISVDSRPGRTEFRVSLLTEKARGTEVEARREEGDGE